MKLIKQTSLHCQEGTSDKIYEVDLCQTGEDSYVVNFRYGRRGTKLREGTKTSRAVPLTEAQGEFDKLVASKIKGGYREVTAPAPAPAPAPPPISQAKPNSENARKQAILKRLTTLDDSKWPYERVIWRAGELKISEATPLLILLIGTGDALRDYCIAAALGWCGGKKAIPALIQLYQNASTPEFVSRIAFEALLKLSDLQTRAGLQSEMIELLPEQLRSLARNGSAESFSTALRTYLDTTDYQHFAVLDTIYQIDNEYVRPGLLEIVRTAPFKPNYFKHIRHIFKMAEYRHDSEIFAILAYRFEREEAMYRSNKNYIRLPDGGYLRRYEWEYNSRTRTYEQFEKPEFSQEMQRPNARLAYSNKTREYLLRRVWRTLKQLGEESEPDYVNMAVSILLQYSDSDAEEVRQTTLYRWNRSNWTRTSFTRDWDAYAGYLTLNHILYENSPRYVLMPNSKAWRCRESYKPGDPEPETREEAFAQLWEQRPDALLQLLLESNCRPVHHFAVKALRTCKQFCAEIDINTLISLLNNPYEVTAQLSFELARERYNPTSPNLELILALANCSYQPARTQAHQWIESKLDRYLSSSNIIAALVTSQHADTRQFARRLLSSSNISDTIARVLIGRIIAELLTFELTQAEIAKEIGETLLVSFALQLRNLGMGIIIDILKHPMPEIQEIGARILLNHETRAIDLPPELIELLLVSPYNSIRAIGVRIFGQLPDEKLMEDSALIVTMAINAEPEMRKAIRPAIQRLATNHPNFGIQLASDFIDILLTPEQLEGVHKDVVLLLRDDIPGWISGIPRETAMRLLQAKSSAAQELGGVVLNANSERFLNEFDTSEIVKLASHEILSIRSAAREMFLHRLDTIRTDSQELLSAVRLLESKWEDSREFARKIFSCFSNVEWTPEIMVSICDSIREDVRQFGRDLVTRTFKESYGQEYLLKFSEHPSADMQMFVTNYLENYAVDNADRLQELKPYFIAVLSSVNRGRVAKRRIFAFLDTEAQKSEAAARIVAEILTRQSATIAIGDKAAALQTMLKIHKQYPQIPLPIQVKPVSRVGTAHQKS